jgi:hypothetical protein
MGHQKGFQINGSLESRVRQIEDPLYEFAAKSKHSSYLAAAAWHF